MLAIQQHQLVLSCSVFLIQFSLTQIFSLISLLLFCLADLILVFEILIRSTVTNSYSVLCHALLKDFSFALIFSTFCLLVEISVKLTAMSYYLILYNIFRKDFLFVFSNFKNANFSSVCIQHVKVNLTNLIDKDLISSINQIQLKADNQL